VESQKKISVFIASPGDLSLERAKFKEVVDALNKEFASGENVEFEALGWEDILASTGRRTQSVINQDIDRCDIFILCLHRRWGQNAPDTEYSSYTEEEFHRALDRWKKDKSPEIFVFFKQVDPGQEADPGPQLDRVMEFRRQLDESRAVMYRNVGDEEEFGEEVDRHLRAFVRGDLPSVSHEVVSTLPYPWQERKMPIRLLHFLGKHKDGFVILFAAIAGIWIGGSTLVNYFKENTALIETIPSKTVHAQDKSLLRESESDGTTITTRDINSGLDLQKESLDHVAGPKPTDLESPPGSSHYDQHPDVQTMLRKCNDHVENNHLTSGADGNAYDCFQKVLETHASNHEATTGLKKIEEKYLYWFNSAIENNEKSKAEIYLEKISLVNPDNLSLSELQEKINNISIDQSDDAKTKNVKDTLLKRRRESSVNNHYEATEGTN